jgi:hypothetical protein
MVTSLERRGIASLTILICVVAAALDWSSAAAITGGRRSWTGTTGCRTWRRTPARGPSASIQKFLPLNATSGAAPIQWADPVLGDGPFVVHSAVPASSQSARRGHGEVPAAVVDSHFSQTGTSSSPKRPGRLRIIRNGVLDPNPVPGVPRVHRAGTARTDGRAFCIPRFAEKRSGSTSRIT